MEYINGAHYKSSIFEIHYSQYQRYSNLLGPHINSHLSRHDQLYGSFKKETVTRRMRNRLSPLWTFTLHDIYINFIFGHS